MKTIPQLFLLLSLIAGLSSCIGVPQNCDTSNCAFCLNAKCSLCFNSYPDTAGNCIPTPSTYDKNCELYTNVIGCEFCKPNYALDKSSKNLAQVCFYNVINRCMVQIKKGSTPMCDSCSGTYPTTTGYSCGTEPLAPNCIWGRRNPKGDKECARCQEGFTVVNGECVASTVDGCWLGPGDGYCTFCDVFNGYTMANYYTCNL